METFDKTKKKPFKFLSGVFKRGRNYELKISEDMLYGTEDYHGTDQLIGSPETARSTKGSTTPGRDLDLDAEMESLHLSRRDNPYLSSCEALDDIADPDDTSLSPPPGSPRQANLSMSPVESQSFSPESITELHSHLVRSPPPVHWPSKTMEFDSSNDWSVGQSGRAFSPESGDRSDGMETERSFRSQSEERAVSPIHQDYLTTMSPVRGQTPALSPARGQTPDFSPPPLDRLRMGSNTDSRVFHPAGSTYIEQRTVSPRAYSHSYQRSVSHSGQRLRSKTPDEEFSPSRFNIYTLHQRGMNLRDKSESSYLVSSPGREHSTFHYQPASRRSLAQLASSARSGSTPRKSSTEHFLSWIPRRSRSQSRSDAKSMENLQSHNPVQGIRNLREASGFSHKSLSCMGGDGEGLINSEGGTYTVSPRPPRKRFSGIKKSLSLKQKKSSMTGPFYVDIDTQDHL